MSGTGYALGVHCGITFAGLKPASLFWLDDETGGDMAYYKNLFAKKDFRFLPVKHGEGRKLFYVFHRARLEKILFVPENRAFLSEQGYEYSCLGGALKKLKQRMQNSAEFPHEVGLFLGYPLCDVRGFMQDARGGICLGCGYWKVYENAEECEKLFTRYERCSRCIRCKMHCGTPIEKIFGLG